MGWHVSTQYSCTLEIVAYNKEELSYFGTIGMGSHFHASNLVKKGKKVRGMLCLEMIGFFSDEEIQTIIEPFFPSQGNWIALIGRLDEPSFVYQLKGAMLGTTNTPLYSLGVTTSSGATSFSDHRNYWAQDIPAVMITNTAFMRNSNYHTANDTPDTLNY